jgi:RNA polymerase sigma-70 factor, ECF subfamily
MDLTAAATVHQDARRLADRAAAGSMEALASLYDAHAQRVYRIAFRLLASSLEAEDVVQDVFVGLPRALRGWKGQNLDAWIAQVAARTALMRLRSNRRRDARALDSLERCVQPAGLPVERVALERALDSLQDDLRTVFMLKVVEGYSHDEIAGLLGITALASRTRLARARARLAHLLG